jgi:hypothetical protein
MRPTRRLLRIGTGGVAPVQDVTLVRVCPHRTA